jgi:hypothetical protein
MASIGLEDGYEQRVGNDFAGGKDNLRLLRNIIPAFFSQRLRKIMNCFVHNIRNVLPE